MDDERASIEGRVVAALDEVRVSEEGEYHPISSLTRTEVLSLAECRLIPFELTLPVKPGTGVYVSADQMMGVAVNGSDHLCTTMLASGLQFEDLWTHLSALDDLLARTLDYAFDKRLGFLTASLGHTGTGLRAGVVLHLPGLVASNRVSNLVQAARQRRQAVHGLKSSVSAAAVTAASSSVARKADAEAAIPSDLGEAFYMDLTGALYGDVSEAEGDLFLLANLATLGVSEEEILFHLRHAASEIIAQELEARETLWVRERRRLEDRVYRAQGVARNARVLGFPEAAGLWSSLRLGIEAEWLDDVSLEQVNGLLFMSQAGHLRAKAGRDCDEWRLSTERADLWRAGLAAHREG
jgi:protein arginine kinase